MPCQGEPQPWACWNCLQAMHPLNPHVKVHLLTPKLPSCHITLYYYSAFAYMMLRRYTDAGACLNGVLSYISRCACHAGRAARSRREWRAVVSAVVTGAGGSALKRACKPACRVKAFHQRSTQYDQMLKKNEQVQASLLPAPGLIAGQLRARLPRHPPACCPLLRTPRPPPPLADVRPAGPEHGAVPSGGCPAG